MSLLIAIAVVAAGWWVIKSFSKASPTQSRTLTNKLSAYGLLAFAAFVTSRGNFEYAVPVAALALGMLGYQHTFGSKSQPAPAGSNSESPQRGKIRMSRDEALRVLGLKSNATADDVKAAHRRLLKDFHPDKGGTDYLAAKINEAKDVLLSA